MNVNILSDDASITFPKGYLASGVACGIKKNGAKDLALITSSVPATASGLFTRNLVKGHSLIRSMNVLASNMSNISAIVINSGNANACIGADGDAAAEQMAEFASMALNLAPDNILTGSTGVIGKRMPMNLYRVGIYDAAASLGSNSKSGHDAEEAIMTTDTRPKEYALSYISNKTEIRIAGMAKGSGMIHPDMATMIGIITTDCAITPEVLYVALKDISDKSFNRISVDGDTSVCDMVLVLANGLAGNNAITSVSCDEYKDFVYGLEIVCRNLARGIASDGEGATKLIEINAINAASREDALKIIQSIAKSPLVKTAIFGEDANWGRILTAAGYSGASFNPGRCSIMLGSLTVCENGAALDFDEIAAKNILREHDITITIDLADGCFSDTIWTCDFSYDYIKINGSYRS